MMEFWQGWEIISMIIVGISILGSAIAIMIARMFSLPNLEASAKAELVFAISTALLVVFIITLVKVGDAIALEYAKQTFYNLTGEKPNYANFWEITKAYMNKIYDCYIKGEKIVVATHSAIMVMTGFKVSSQMYDPSGVFSAGPISDFLTSNLKLLLFFKLYYKLMIKTMDLMVYIGFPLLLPAGIALRAFPPTRGTGAYLIALALGVYFVFPLSYIAALSIVPYPLFCPLDPLYLQFQSFLPTDPCAFGSVGTTYYFRIVGNMIISNKFNLLNIPKALGKNCCIGLCVFPFIALMIFFSFLNSGSSLFGANIPEVGRGLVKLI